MENEKKYEQEDNSILIVLSDHEQYYFETAIVKENGEVYQGTMCPHIGTFQDSCLIFFDGYVEEHKHEKCIDIRYFPHIQHLEAYCWDTAGLPVYLENAGERGIFFTTNSGIIELEQGERKLVCKENAVKKENKPMLNRGDLYPALFLE